MSEPRYSFRFGPICEVAVFWQLRIVATPRASDQKGDIYRVKLVSRTRLRAGGGRQHGVLI